MAGTQSDSLDPTLHEDLPPGQNRQQSEIESTEFPASPACYQYVASCPRTAQLLQKELRKSHPDRNILVVIRGSQDHILALKRLHTQQSRRRDELRIIHGEVFDTCEKVHRTLDSLSTQLQRLTNHESGLKSTFSMYGYGAHLRAYDEKLDPNAFNVSPENVLTNSPEQENPGIWQEKTAAKFYKQPVIRQYFHKGLLWRASGMQGVGPFELFVDLIYVGILNIIGERVSDEPTGIHFHRYVIFMFLTWKIWNDLNMLISWFETDDIVQKVFILLNVVCLCGFSVNMLEAFAGDTWVQLVGFYIASRAVVGLYCLLQYFFVPAIRGMMVCGVVTMAIPITIWVTSIFVDLPRRFICIWIAILLDSFGLTWTIFIQRDAGRFSTRFQAWFDRNFELYPAINIEHKSERTKQFVTLVIGYEVGATLYQNAAAFGLNSFFGKAVLGLVQGFTINWIYFAVDSEHIHVHAIRRHVITSLFWLSIHLPLVMGLALAGASMSKLVVAHDCPDAHLSDLSDLIENYKKSSVAELSTGLRWFYCAGLAATVFIMTAISLSHIHKEVDSPRIKKKYRILFRISIGCVIAGLALARGLNSLDLLSITTALNVSILAFEIYGSSHSSISFFGSQKFLADSIDYIALSSASQEDVRGATTSDKVLDVERVGANVGRTATERVYRANFRRQSINRDLEHTNTLQRSSSTYSSGRTEFLETMYGLR